MTITPTMEGGERSENETGDERPEGHSAREDSLTPSGGCGCATIRSLAMNALKISLRTIFVKPTTCWRWEQGRGDPGRIISICVETWRVTSASTPKKACFTIPIWMKPTNAPHMLCLFEANPSMLSFTITWRNILRSRLLVIGKSPGFSNQAGCCYFKRQAATGTPCWPRRRLRSGFMNSMCAVLVPAARRKKYFRPFTDSMTSVRYRNSWKNVVLFVTSSIAVLRQVICALADSVSCLAFCTRGPSKRDFPHCAG